MPNPIRWIAPAAISILAPSSYAVQYLTVEQAQTLIFPPAKHFTRIALPLTPEQMRSIEDRSGISVRNPELLVWQARDEQKLLGWFIIDEVYGKHELITYAVGITVAGSVRQIEVLHYRESYGYEIRNPAWRRQFVGKRAGDTLKLDGDIKNISGATLSCRHITEGVRRVLATYELMLK
jgi:Na+-translocating ferredoxin:NAD+ oxidoreductase RnfG subunit